MNINSEAIQISLDLKEVVFVGAFAVTAHVGAYRRTADIDLALASTVDDAALERMGYHLRLESGKEVRRTPGGVKIDIFRRDVGGISVKKIFETAEDKSFGKRRLKVMGLEALLLAKHRAQRPQDIEDMRMLIVVRSRAIRWDILESMATPVEVAELKKTVSAMG